MRQENNDSPRGIFKAPEQGLLLKKQINRKDAEAQSLPWKANL